MILQNITITRISYGDDEGQYDCSVGYTGANSRTKLSLDRDTTTKILAVVADLIVESSKEVAATLTAEVIDQTKSLTHEVAE